MTAASISASHQTGRLSLLMIFIMIICGCSSTGSPDDPLESFNRRTHQFNMAVDAAVLRPVASAYSDITPSPLQTGISNFYANLGYPLVAVNQFLQGKFRLGLRDGGRFIVNSTLGI
ncbi:MAG: MlaA family lipoprotein, partial [Pseudohongiellaceae bacterium]